MTDIDMAGFYLLDRDGGTFYHAPGFVSGPGVDLRADRPSDTATTGERADAGGWGYWRSWDDFLAFVVGAGYGHIFDEPPAPA